jgi:hypothetical protein
LEDIMLPRTTFLSKLLGIYCILISLSMAAHRHATVEAMTALLQSPPLVFIAGIMAVAAGLAMVLGHNVWSGGVLPVSVTLIGWLSLIKGVLLLFLSPEMASGFFLAGLRYEQLFNAYAAIALVLGIYLTYGGFREAAR